MGDVPAITIGNLVADLADLIPRPALLPGEDEAAYDTLRQELIDEFHPRTPYEMALVQNLADIEWEGHRYRALRDDLLRARIQELATEAFEPDRYSMHPSTEAQKLGRDLVGADPREQAKALKILASKGTDFGTLRARAYSAESRTLAAIERHIADLEDRRRRLIVDLDNVRANRAVVVSESDQGFSDDI